LDFIGEEHNLGHMVPKQERRFWQTLGVTNLKQYQESKPSQLLEQRDA
jgi:hypothetical protein